MTSVRIQRLDDVFVIYFGTATPRINAYTLATTLTNLADAAKAANAAINPGYEIEIVVEALAGGSFKAQIRALYKQVGNLFSEQAVNAVILSVLANFIYQHTLAPDAQVTVNVGASEVVIEQGDTRVVVPREVHDATQAAEKSPAFRAGVARAMQALERDSTVETFGFSYDMADTTPPIEIRRPQFALLPRMLGEDDPNTRDIIEVTDVQILRAILERSKRRWEFVWNGIRIAAPVTDQVFYDDFFAHKVKIAPGDMLRVRLRIRQKRHKEAPLFINESYEVITVLSHMPEPEQQRLAPE